MGYTDDIIEYAVMDLDFLNKHDSTNLSVHALLQPINASYQCTSGFLVMQEHTVSCFGLL